MSVGTRVNYVNTSKYIRPAVFFIGGDLKIKLMYILREAAKSSSLNGRPFRPNPPPHSSLMAVEIFERWIKRF